MPEPDYADGDSPGFWGCFIGAVVLIVIFFVVKGCA